jgi:hypothetical protein
MKGIKSYLVKIILLLIALGSITTLYWFGYHKNYDEKSIPQNADGIVMVDVKNIRNYLVFSYLKNPSQWQFGSTRLNKKFDFSNFGIETPDYLAFFHLENQPINQWLTVAKIENENDFDKAITKERFSKTVLKNGMNSYYSEPLGLCIIKHSNQILCSAIPKEQKEIAINVAEDLFLKHRFLDTKKTEKTIETSNAVTVWIKKNNLLEEDAILNFNLKDQEIVAEGQLKWKPNFIKTASFSQNPNALLSLGFNFEMIRNQNILKNHSVQINKIIGFDLDSILAHNPTKTELLLNGMIEKKDSAISYDYDDDFNPIKKVIVHTSREPSFCFSIQTEDSKKVFNYLKAQNAVDNHHLFVNFPLAPTKAFVRNNTLTLEANLPEQWTLHPSSTKIGYLQIHFNKLKPQDWRYIITKNKNFRLLKSFETLTIDLTQKNTLGHFQGRLKTQNGRSLIEVIK